MSNVNQNTTTRQKRKTRCFCQRFVQMSSSNIIVTRHVQMNLFAHPPTNGQTSFSFATSPNEDFSNKYFLHQKSLSIYTTYKSVIQLVSVFCNFDLFSRFSDFHIPAVPNYFRSSRTSRTSGTHQSK